MSDDAKPRGMRGLEGRDLYQITHPPRAPEGKRWDIPATRPHEEKEKCR